MIPGPHRPPWGVHYLPAFLLFPFQVADPQQVFLLCRQLPRVWTDGQLVTGCSHRLALGLSQLLLKLSNLRGGKTRCSAAGLPSDSTARRATLRGDGGPYQAEDTTVPDGCGSPRGGGAAEGRDLRWHLEQNKRRH